MAKSIVGLIGLGTVGSGVVQLLQNAPSVIQRAVRAIGDLEMVGDGVHLIRMEEL